MTPRERGAAAIWASDHSGACEWHKVPQAEQELYLRNFDAAVAAFTLMAAERGWYMRPDEATGEWIVNCSIHGGFNTLTKRQIYNALMAKAPKYEVGE